MAMIWLMMKDATKPPIMLPRPPSTQIMKITGPNVLPMIRMHVVLQSQQACGETGQRAADCGRHQIDAALIDAHEADNVAILCDRADRGADIGALEKQVEQDRAHQPDAKAISRAKLI